MKISIITVCRNAADTILDCLASVKGQRVPGNLTIEHIICDGLSSDGTLEVIRDFTTTAGFDSRIIYQIVSEKDDGLYDALNKGVALATGDIVGVLHADDFYASSEILCRVAQAFSAADTQACYGDLVYIKEQVGALDASRFQLRRYWQSGPFEPRSFYQGWMPPHPTFFVRRNLYERLGGFRTDLGTAADYELMLRYLLKNSLPCHYLAEVLVCMRTGGASNHTVFARFSANRGDREAWRVNGISPLPWTMFLKPFRKLKQWSCRCIFLPARWWSEESPAESGALLPANLAAPVLVMAALWLCSSSFLHAQEGVFRYSEAGPQAYARGRAQQAPPGDGLRIGGVYLQAAAGLSTIFNSNTNLSKSNPVPDLYVTPEVTVGFFIPLSGINKLNLNLSVGYQAGFNKNDPKRNKLLIGSNSTALDLRIFSGDFMLRLYDAPALSTTPLGDPTLTNTGDYYIFQNTAGLALTMDLYKLIATFGTEWRTQTALGSSYTNLNQNNYVSYLTVSVPVTTSISMGSFTTMDATLYNSNSSVLANSYSFTTGVEVDESLTKYTDISFRAGVQYILFSGGSESVNNAGLHQKSDIPAITFGNSYLGPYLEMAMVNRLNKWVTQRFAFSNQATPSSTADFVYYISANYSIDWRFASKWSSTLFGQAGGGINQGQFNDVFTLYNGGLQLNYTVDQKTSISVNANYSYRSSDVEELSYGSFIVGANINYAF